MIDAMQFDTYSRYVLSKNNTISILNKNQFYFKSYFSLICFTNNKIVKNVKVTHYPNRLKNVSKSYKKTIHKLRMIL